VKIRHSKGMIDGVFTFKKIITISLLSVLLTACGGSNQSVQKSISGPNGDASLMNQHPDSLYKLGVGFESSGDAAQALSFFGQAAAAAPTHVPSWLGIGRILKKMGNNGGARLAFNDALAANPNDVSLVLAASEIEILDDHASSAIIKMAPIVNHPDYRISNLLGVASEMMGSQTVARDYYSDALSYNPNAPDVLSNLALSFAFSGDQVTAVALLQENLQRSDYKDLALEYLAIIYAVDGQMDAAMAIANDLFGRADAISNASFYEALQYLTPQMRARAVYTKRLTDDMRAIANRKRSEHNH